MVDPDEIDTRVDVLRYDTPDGTVYRSVGAGHGDAVVAAHEDEYRTRRKIHAVKLIALAAILGVAIVFVTGRPVLAVVVSPGVLVGGWYGRPEADGMVPELVLEDAMPSTATEEYEIESHTDRPY